MTTRRRNAPAPVDAQILPAVRLPAPAAALTELGLDVGTWKVLTESIFPSAKTPEGVLLAVRYCQARKLDIMRRPVHVVPMWSKALGREVETVWPGIAEVQTTAARTGQWAGFIYDGAADRYHRLRGCPGHPAQAKEKDRRQNDR